MAKHNRNFVGTKAKSCSKEQKHSLMFEKSAKLALTWLMIIIIIFLFKKQ